MVKTQDTNGWVEVHSFSDGFGWKFAKDGKEYYLYTSDINLKTFNEMSHDDKIQLANKIDEENKKRIAKLPKVEPLTNFSLPLIKKTYPPLIADDFVSYTPMTKL